MKTNKFAVFLFALTILVIFAFPYYQNANALTNTALTTNTVQFSDQSRPKIEVVFVLDTTSSMNGMIQAAKEKIWSIASSMASAQSAPEIKMGLVAFRDRGDAYVTKVIDLSSDLDSMNAKLLDFRAEGGGDGPESVNQALYEAVNKISWSMNQNAYKVIFLVGDAPPHTDYENDVQYPESLQMADQKGIVINTIQCGQQTTTKIQWQQIASLGKGRYFQVEQAGSAVAISTPYDKQLASLASQLDATRLYYGNQQEQKRQQKKQNVARKLDTHASEESLARRAMFNVSKSGSNNFLGEKELVDAVSSGRIGLASIDQKQLPKAMQTMAVEKQQQIILKKSKRRKQLKHEIAVLSEKRNDHIEQQLKEQGGALDSLDQQIYATVRAQASKKGFIYEDDHAKY
ncbi:MAG TPA: VWA domain-containing protein [Crenotrichaceae bacterium]|nr:VWA domain-containing protein [Crenotrichaceae bacterium]